MINPPHILIKVVIKPPHILIIVVIKASNVGISMSIITDNLSAILHFVMIDLVWKYGLMVHDAGDEISLSCVGGVV